MYYTLEKLLSIEIEVIPTALLRLTLTYDGDFQSQASYGHDPYICEG